MRTFIVMNELPSNYVFERLNLNKLPESLGPPLIVPLGPRNLTLGVDAPLLQDGQEIWSYEKFALSIGKNDIIFLLDGFRRHERFSHRKIRQVVFGSGASVRTIQTAFPSVFVHNWKSKVIKLAQSPDLWKGFIINLPQLLYDLLMYRLIPAMMPPNKRLPGFNVLYAESSIIDVDSRLIDDRTTIKSIPRRDEQSPGRVSPTRIPIRHAANVHKSLCVVIDPGFYCHVIDRRFHSLWHSKLTINERRQKTRAMMFRVLERAADPTLCLGNIIIALHPNVYPGCPNDIYAPFESYRGSTQHLLRRANTILSFGSSLSTQFRESQRLILVDTRQDVRNSLVIRLLAASLRSELWFL